MKVKLCGMGRPEDIAFVNEFMPDYAGFILSPGFKRSVTKETFLRLNELLDKNIGRVGVFVNEPIENILGFAPNLDVIQLHGDEDMEFIQNLRKSSPCKIWKAVRVSSPEDIENADRLSADCLLLDAFVKGSYGGTGKTVDLDMIRRARFDTPFFIAGGLDCGNVGNIMKNITPVPQGADVSGGIETDGFKDREKIKKFMEIIRSV